MLRVRNDREMRLRQSIFKQPGQRELLKIHVENRFKISHTHLCLIHSAFLQVLTSHIYWLNIFMQKISYMLHSSNFQSTTFYQCKIPNKTKQWVSNFTFINKISTLVMTNYRKHHIEIFHKVQELISGKIARCHLPYVSEPQPLHFDNF